MHWINHYPLGNSIGFASVYPLDSDLSGGQRYPSFEQLGPDQCSFFSWVLSTLDEADSVPSGQLIIGGDFNVHLEAEMDSIGGRKGKQKIR